MNLANILVNIDEEYINKMGYEGWKLVQIHKIQIKDLLILQIQQFQKLGLMRAHVMEL